MAEAASAEDAMKQAATSERAFALAFLEELVATHFPGQYPKMQVVGNQGIPKAVFVGLDDLEQEPRS